MASITFSPGTVIPSTWLNDVNVAVYNTLPTLAPKISPVFTTPTLGVATATSINKNYFTQPATNCTWTLADGKTFNVGNTLTINGTDGAVLTLGSGTNSVSGTFSGTASGTNTGDQLVFKTISVSGQSDVVADTTSDTLTLVAGTNISLTTDATADSVTINSTAPSSALVLLGQATISTPVSTINFLTSFSSSYDVYRIELINFSGSATAAVGFQFAVAGAAATSNLYCSALTPSGGTLTVNSPYVTAMGISVNAGASAEILVRNVNGTATYRYVYVLGVSDASPLNGESFYASGSVLTGFRLISTNAATITGGTVRVYGIRNT